MIEPARRPVRQTGVMDAFDVFGNAILLTPDGQRRARSTTRVGAEVDLREWPGVRRMPVAQSTPG